jgi:hypothetical protein
MDCIHDLQSLVRRMFNVAGDYFDLVSRLTGRQTYSIMADEYRAGQDVVEVLIDFWGRFTSHEALVVVRQSLHRFHDELLPEYQLLDQQLTHLFREIDRVEPSYRAPETTVEVPIAVASAGEARR